MGLCGTAEGTDSSWLQATTALRPFAHAVFAAGRVGNGWADATRFPAAARLAPYVLDLAPGDILLVPWSMPHAVANIGGATLALAGNLVLSTRPVPPAMRTSAAAANATAAARAATIARAKADWWRDVASSYRYPRACDPFRDGRSNAAAAVDLARRELLLLKRLHDVSGGAGFAAELAAERKQGKRLEDLPLSKPRVGGSVPLDDVAGEEEEEAEASSLPFSLGDDGSSLPFWFGTYKPFFPGSSAHNAALDILGPELERRVSAIEPSNASSVATADALGLSSLALQALREGGVAPPAFLAYASQRAAKAAREAMGGGRGEL